MTAIITLLVMACPILVLPINMAISWKYLTITPFTYIVCSPHGASALTIYHGAISKPSFIGWSRWHHFSHWCQVYCQQSGTYQRVKQGKVVTCGRCGIFTTLTSTTCIQCCLTHFDEGLLAVNSHKKGLHVSQEGFGVRDKIRKHWRKD